MGEKINKPLIIITAALSIAVITLSVQVVLLTFSVKDQKDTVRQLLTRTNTAYNVENRYTELNGSLQQLRREAESIKNETVSLSDELDSLREIIAKINTDAQFMQIELNDVSARLMQLEKVRHTTSTAAQSISDESSALKDELISERSTAPTSGQNTNQTTELTPTLNQEFTSQSDMALNSALSPEQNAPQNASQNALLNSQQQNQDATELNTVYPIRQMDEDNAYFDGSEHPSSLTVTSIPATNVSLSPEDAAKLEREQAQAHAQSQIQSQAQAQIQSQAQIPSPSQAQAQSQAQSSAQVQLQP